ncbi:hypothetical protein GCM10023184_36040 [Flaviaesturariibacter amylovorans]|uniref:Uncharacterized protein n=1 Tax=Flaviaesturariibacter amylovorans TaxID=1084520 RepID=A0ABP8HGV6_9BACT
MEMVFWPKAAGAASRAPAIRIDLIAITFGALKLVKATGRPKRTAPLFNVPWSEAGLRSGATSNPNNILPTNSYRSCCRI